MTSPQGVDLKKHAQDQNNPCYLLYSLPGSPTSFSRAMYFVCMPFFLLNSSKHKHNNKHQTCNFKTKSQQCVSINNNNPLTSQPHVLQHPARDKKKKKEKPQHEQTIFKIINTTFNQCIKKQYQLTQTISTDHTQNQTTINLTQSFHNPNGPIHNSKISISHQIKCKKHCLKKIDQTIIQD